VVARRASTVFEKCSSFLFKFFWASFVISVSNFNDFLFLLQSTPLQKGFIRGSSILSGYYVQKKGEGLSLTYVSQVDLKGNAAFILFKIVLIFLYLHLGISSLYNDMYRYEFNSRGILQNAKWSLNAE